MENPNRIAVKMIPVPSSSQDVAIFELNSSLQEQQQQQQQQQQHDDLPDQEEDDQEEEETPSHTSAKNKSFLEQRKAADLKNREELHQLKVSELTKRINQGKRIFELEEEKLKYEVEVAKMAFFAAQILYKNDTS